MAASHFMIHLPFIQITVESRPMDYFKKALISTALLSVLSSATPAFAQMYPGMNLPYSTYYPSSYSYPSQSGYGSGYGSQNVYQVTNIPQNISIPTYMTTSIPTYNTNTYPSYQQPRTSQYTPQYQSAPQPNFYYTYPPVNQVRYTPSSSYQYGNGSTYSYPTYDSSYAPYSNYYTQYPQQNLGYTGDRDALGTPLCDWQGYGRSDCSFNPHQWVYDPYSGTWY